MRSQSDQQAPPRTEAVDNPGAGSPAPVAAAAASMSAPSSNQVIGSGLASLSGTGSPGDDPIGLPTDLVLLAGTRREFGGRGRARQAVASSGLTSPTGADEPTPFANPAATKTLSALATPRAAASPLESFIGSVGSLINTALTAISNAVTTALTAINTAATTAITAISNTITNLLTAVGLVSRPNQSPTAVNDGGLTTAEDTAVSVSTATLVGNDSDPDGDTLTVTGVSAPAHGSAVLSGATVTYTPNQNFAGADSFTYSVADGHGGTATGTVGVTVTPVNDAPVAGSDTVTTAEDTAVGVTAVTLLGNDSDADGDTLTVTGVSSGTHGTAVLSGATVTYTPNQNFSGADSFTYSVADGHGGTATGTVGVTVTPVNDAPVAGSDIVTTAEDTAVSIAAGALVGNDSDADGDTLTVTGVSSGTHGTAVLSGATVTYTPNQNFSGADSFTYSVADGHGGTATGTVSVTVTVTPVNTRPIAVDDTVTTAEDTAVSITAATLLGNDSDPDGDLLTIGGIGQPQHGTTELVGGTVIYNPDLDFNGDDSFSYTVSDGNGGTVTATVAVTVTPVNDPPSPLDDVVATPENTAATIDVLGNDVDGDGNPLTVVSTGLPKHGTAVANEDGTVTYTPDENYTGSDSFGYTISDGITEASATVTVNVGSVVNPLQLSDFTRIQLHVTSTGDVYVVGRAFIEEPGTGYGYDKNIVGLLNEDGSVTMVLDMSDIVPNNFSDDVAIGPDGRIYVLDDGWYGADGSLTRYDHDGTSHVIVQNWDFGEYAVRLGQDLSGDEVHLAVGNDGKIYLTAPVATAENVVPSALTVLNADGTVAVAPIDLGFDHADIRDLVVGADGRTYVLGDDASSSANVVVIVGQDGSTDRISLGNLHVQNMAVGADGTAFVANGNTVIAVNASGPFGTLNGFSAGSTNIDDIAIGPQGLYALNNGGLTVADPTDIHFETGVVDSLDDFTLLAGLAFGPNGVRYVAGAVNEFDTTVTRLARVNVDGTLTDLGYTPLVGFGSIAAGQDGTVYVAGRNGITAIDTTTGLSSVIPVTSGYTSHVAVGDDGNIYFTGYRISETGLAVNYLSVINAAGNVLVAPVELADHATTQLTGLAVGPDGRIYLTSYAPGGPSAVLTVLNSSGSIETSVSLSTEVPTGVAVGADGTAYIIGQGRVIAVDSTGPIGTVRTDWAGGSYIGSIATGPDGLLYAGVTNFGQGGTTSTTSISVLDPTDLVDSGTTSGLGGFTGLYGIAVGSGGQKYVLGNTSDANGTPTTKLVSVSADGTSITQLVDLGPGSGAIDVEIGSDGRIYVTDNLHGTVTAYDPANNYASQLIGAVPGAAGLAIGNGRIYISSVTTNADASQTGALTILNADGSLVTSVELGDAAPGVSVGPDGRVYVATFTVADGGSGQSGDGALLIFNANGVLQNTVTLAGRLPYNVTVGPDGTAYIADLTGHVVAVGQDGAVSDLAAVALPFGLDVGPDGLLYVTSIAGVAGHGPTITVINPATTV
ncbi:tandem-95 repeat protein [Mycolicibacterium sp. P1-5]|uniref:tandem-95 repeat protein n=1 Tax=Mycolicibacterium sp. P1-5 TaxID=2024617 RepID=UPI0018846600|nr:tandem-95 repeat protein [Mycolicibacterium sp. P1-5]